MEKQLAQAKQVNSLVEKQLVSTTEVHQESQQKRGPEDQYTRQLETNLVNSRRLVSNPARVVLQIVVNRHAAAIGRVLWLFRYLAEQ